jgi:hypothetical protein
MFYLDCFLLTALPRGLQNCIAFSTEFNRKQSLLKAGALEAIISDK